MENPRESSSWTWKLKKIRKSISLVWKILQTFLYLYPIFPLQKKKKKKNTSRNPRVEILQLESSCSLKLDRPFSLPLLLSITGWNCCRHRRPRVYTLPPNQIFIWWCIRDAGSFHASNPSPRGAEGGGRLGIATPCRRVHPRYCMLKFVPRLSGAWHNKSGFLSPSSALRATGCNRRDIREEGGRKLAGSSFRPVY